MGEGYPQVIPLFSCRATEAFSVHQQQPQDVLKATALAVEVAQAVTWDGDPGPGAGCFPQWSFLLWFTY